MYHLELFSTRSQKWEKYWPCSGIGSQPHFQTEQEALDFAEHKLCAYGRVVVASKPVVKQLTTRLFEGSSAIVAMMKCLLKYRHLGWRPVSACPNAVGLWDVCIEVPDDYDVQCAMLQTHAINDVFHQGAHRIRETLLKMKEKYV